MRKWKKLRITFILALLMTLFIGDHDVYASDDVVDGADIGWLSQLENQGVTWIDDSGNATDALLQLKNKGINTVRIRAFVNPPSSFEWTKPSGYTVYLGYADTQGVLYTAQRANDLGMKISLVLHYSDHFADPGIQDIPEQWKDADAEELEKYVYDYTYYMMSELAKLDIYPEYVEVGNEINGGILFPYGKSTENFEQLAGYLNSGYDAVKAVSPDTKVVTHLANGQSSSNYVWFFDNFLNTYSGKTDVIGMSYYPYWAGNRVIQDLTYNLNYIATRYNKEVMICETGDSEADVEGTYDLLQKEISAIKTVANGKGIGLIYWEPEANSTLTPEGYPLGATEKISDNVYKYTSALDAFGIVPEFLDETNSFAIYNYDTEKTLNVVGGSYENSASIEQYKYDEWDSQKWTFEKIDGNYYKIVNKNSGKVLEVPGLSTGEGVICTQYEYNGGWNQMWEITADSNGIYRIQNRWSGLYLGISNKSDDDGAMCIQTDKDSDNCTGWYFLVTE